MHTRSHKDFMNTDLTKVQFMSNMKGPIRNSLHGSHKDLMNTDFTKVQFMRNGKGPIRNAHTVQ